MLKDVLDRPNIKDLLAWTKCLTDVLDRTKCPARVHIYTHMHMVLFPNSVLSPS